MTPTTQIREEWPSWAKALLIAIALLAVISVVPWIFMTTAMAATCAPMMGNMRDMMEMMR